MRACVCVCVVVVVVVFGGNMRSNDLKTSPTMQLRALNSTNNRTCMYFEIVTVIILANN